MLLDDIEGEPLLWQLEARGAAMPAPPCRRRPAAALPPSWLGVTRLSAPNRRPTPAEMNDEEADCVVDRLTEANLE